MIKVRRFISIIILLVLIIVSVCKVSAFLQRKESKLKYSSFLVEDCDIDIVTIGSSHVRNGIFPMELWNDYGISAYNLAGDGGTLPMCYWTLVNALDYQKPQIVVLDIYVWGPNKIFNGSLGHVHDQFDFFPLSFHKYQMVQDLFSDPTVTDNYGNSVAEKRWDLLWNIGEYHSRWSGLNRNDFADDSELVQQSAVWKGASPELGIVDRNETIYPDNWDDVEYDNLAREYLIKIIQLCQEKNIDLLLVNTGYDCYAEAKLFADSVYDIADEYDLPYLDFTQMDIINFKTDIYSTGNNTHVNFSGAEKLTKYIGEYLSDNYPLVDHRDDEQYARWQKEYQEFAVSKADYLKNQTDIVYYLELLADDDYQTIIEVKDFSVLSERRNREMLENLGIDIDTIGDCNLLVVDNETKEVSYEKNTYSREAVFDTCIGNIVSFCNESEIVYEMYLDGNELYTTEITDNDTKMQITVIRKAGGEVVDTKVF